MECDFKKELEDELEKMIFLYDFCYFNNAVTQDEIRELGRLIKTHREVIKVLGGKMTKFQQMFYDIKNTRDYKTVGYE